MQASISCKNIRSWNKYMTLPWIQCVPTWMGESDRQGVCKTWGWVFTGRIAETFALHNLVFVNSLLSSAKILSFLHFSKLQVCLFISKLDLFEKLSKAKCKKHVLNAVEKRNGFLCVFSRLYYLIKIFINLLCIPSIVYNLHN